MARVKKVRKRSNRRTIVVRMSPAGPSRATVTAGGTVFPAAIGRGGLAANKREGDGGTPRGRMRFEYGFVRRDRLLPSAARLRLVPIRAGMGWCDAPRHALYNRPVRLPFPASHEKLMRDDGLYDICLVLDWNRTCRRRGCGSAIFLHIARPGHRPTEGCIAVSLAAMRRILAFAGRDTDILVL